MRAPARRVGPIPIQDCCLGLRAGPAGAGAQARALALISSPAFFSADPLSDRRNRPRFVHVPGIIVQGRYETWSGPIRTPMSGGSACCPMRNTVIVPESGTRRWSRASANIFCLAAIRHTDMDKL